MGAVAWHNYYPVVYLRNVWSAYKNACNFELIIYYRI